MSGYPNRSNATNEQITGLSLDELKKIMSSDNFSKLPTKVQEAYSRYATFLLNQQNAGSRGKSRGKSIKKRKSRRNRTGKKSIKKRRKSSRRRR